MAAIARRVYASFRHVSIRDFAKKKITWTYISIFRAENGDAAKFDSHPEFMVLDRCYKEGHLDFDNVANFYRTRRDRLEPVIGQLYK